MISTQPQPQPQPVLTPIQQELMNRADIILDGIASAAKTAGDFASEQVPDVAMQFVAYGRAWATFTEVVGFVLFLVGAWLLVRVGLLNSLKLPNTPGSYGGPDTRRNFFGVVGGFMTIAGFIVVCVNARDFAMAWFAPKVWLLTEIVRLVKS